MNLEMHINRLEDGWIAISGELKQKDHRCWIEGETSEGYQRIVVQQPGLSQRLGLHLRRGGPAMPSR